MKSIIVILGLMIPALGLRAQPEHPRFLIVTSIHSSEGSKDNGLLLLYSDHIIAHLQKELNKELPCVRVITMSNIAASIQHDRDRVILTDGPSNFEEIAGAMGVDYTINVDIFSDGPLTRFNASIQQGRKSTPSSNKNAMARGNDEQKLDEIEKFVKKFVSELVNMQLCPFKGTITLTTERTDEEIHERGNRCGKDNSGYFRGTIKDSYNYFEELVLEKKLRMQADGSMHVRSTEEHMKHEVNSGCVNCWTYEGNVANGIDAGTFTNSDYTQTVKEEYEVNGLASLGDSQLSGKLPAEVAIKFDTIQGTYTIQVKAVSKKGSYIKSTITKNITSCKKFDRPDEIVNNETIVSVSTSFGPFKGKPTDKTLQDSKNETFVEKHDGGQAVSNYKVNFSFSR